MPRPFSRADCRTGLRVLIHASSLREAGALRAGGADAVLSGEGEAALSLSEILMRELGAIDEQIDRSAAASAPSCSEHFWDAHQ